MDQKKIGCFIAELRKEKKLTQTELGELLGVTNKTVSRWETGNYMPDLAIIQRLCEELGIGVNELLSGQRLDVEMLRQQADDNILQICKHEQQMRKQKKISDFFSGAGTGLIVSALYSPETMRKTVVVIIGIGMVLVGWFFRSELDKNIIS
ncbi:MAG: helix-turn-helix transcriptional regulator [Eubacteriales bacterium]|nr:helix-turn-helix transcriptional regulator [Eubacteriales bacterium]